MMKETMSNGHQVQWDGRTVWVNSGFDGCSIGRFTPAGVDVHRTAQEQMDGAAQCLKCLRSAGPEEWAMFRDLMEMHYGVTIPDEATPTRLQPIAQET